MQLSEDLEIELEALGHTYGEDLASEPRPGGGLLLSKAVAPRDEGAAQQHYVGALLKLHVPAGYPEAPPAALLTDARGGPRCWLAGCSAVCSWPGQARPQPAGWLAAGSRPLTAPRACAPPHHTPARLRPAGLGDARLAALQAELSRAAGEALPGEMVLGHLVEVATDLMTAANEPEGDCAFCLLRLDAAPAVLRLDCYHCFHL